MFEEMLLLIQSWKKHCYKAKTQSVERTMCDLLTSNILLISGEISKATETLLSCGTRYIQFSPYGEFWPYGVRDRRFNFSSNEPSNDQSTIFHKETNISNRSFFASNLYSAFKCIGFQRGLSFITAKLKACKSIDNYIDCSFVCRLATNQNLYHLQIRGIPDSLYDSTQFDTPTISKEIKEELEQFCKWHQAFEDGVFDDR